MRCTPDVLVAQDFYAGDGNSAQASNTGNSGALSQGIPKGTDLNITSRSLIDGYNLSYGSVEISAPDDAQLGYWNRKAKLPYSIDIALAVGSQVGLFTKVSFNASTNQDMNGDDFVSTIKNNVSSLNISTAGSVIHFGYVNGISAHGDVIFSGSGKGTGLSYGGTLSFPSLDNLETITLTTGDSIRIAKKDTGVYNFKGGKEFLQKKGIKR